MSNVIEINSLESLKNHRLVWQSLLPSTPGASFFHTLDWFEQYWNHFGPEGSGVCQAMRVLIVYAAEKPIGILPLVIRHEKKLAGQNVRTLGYPLHDWGTSYGPIGPNASATLLSGMRHIEATPRDWDLFELASVDREYTDKGRTPRAMQQVGLSAIEEEHSVAPQVDCREGWDAYWATRTSKHRNNVRRVDKKLAELGEVRYVRYRPEGSADGDDDPRWDLYDACVALSEKSWQGDSTSGTTLSHESIRNFLRDCHLVAVEQGAVDINLLYIDDEPIAFSYNYHYNGYVFGLRMGFDAEVTKQGAGTALLHRALRDSCERGDQIYDLGPGYLSAKRKWWSRLVTTNRYTHYPATALKAQTLRWARQLRGWIKPDNAALGKASPQVASKQSASK